MPNCLEKEIGGFVPGGNYGFDPPVLTNCIRIDGNGGWKQKKFSEGWCLKFENGTGAFQGRPDGEKIIHYFKIDWGKGSLVIELKS